MKLLIKPLRGAPTPLSSPLPPSPPPTPCPWLWRCHSCYTIYRLAVTRRCLDCDHTFCVGEPAGNSTPRGKKRKRGGPCKAEFDYTGWKARGAWRRTVLLNGDNSNKNNAVTVGNARESREAKWGDEHRAATDALGDGASFEDKRERLFVRRRHSCFLHCDFPSECHHALFRAQQEGRPILREAEALDAAEAEAELEAARRETGRGEGRQEGEGGRGKRYLRRLTVQEYKQRRAERRGKSVSAASAARSDGDLDLAAVAEEYDYDDDDEADNVSPCSPTSPDPPGDLMREVSPVESDEPAPPPSGRRRSRASLLVTTDTPVDFAATAAPLSFDDTYSDDEEDGYDDDDYDEYDEYDGTAAREDQRRARSRRKVAQLTGEGPESLGPFILDTSHGPSPTSPLAAANTTHGDRTGAGDNNNNPLTALDLQAAWSEQAWFSSSSSSSSSAPMSGQQQHPPPPKSPARAGRRDRMFALLGRRGSSGGGEGPASPARPPLDAFNDAAAGQAAGEDDRHHQHHSHRYQHHPDATAVAGEEWESWSDSSTSSRSSTSSGASLISSSSTGGNNARGGQGVTAMMTDDAADADGDVPMREAGSAAAQSPPAKDAGDDRGGSPRAPAARNSETDDLMALLRMRNAFMRGEMI